MINRQHWHSWRHWRAAPHHDPILLRKQNSFRLERTDLIIYVMICDSSHQMSPQRRDVLRQDCLFGSAVREKNIFWNKWGRGSRQLKDSQSSLSSWENYRASLYAGHFTSRKGKDSNCEQPAWINKQQTHQWPGHWDIMSPQQVSWQHQTVRSAWYTGCHLGTQTHWSNGSEGTSWNTTKTNAKSCTGGGLTHSVSTEWGQPAQEQFHR